MAEEVTYLSASELRSRYRRRTLSPVEVVHALLARSDALQPKVNAFVLIDREAALHAARASQRALGDDAGGAADRPADRGQTLRRGARATSRSRDRIDRALQAAAARGLSR